MSGGPTLSEGLNGIKQRFSRSSPRAPAWALLLGTGLLDILFFGVLLMLGVEKAEVTPDLFTILWSVTIVFATGMAACLAPSMRTSRLDPLTALRERVIVSFWGNEFGKLCGPV